MAYIKRNGNNTQWILETDESDPLSARLLELRKIFQYYANQGSNVPNGTFVMQLAAIQSKALIEIARQQEKELEQLRAMKKDIAALKAEMAEIKAPAYAKLEKPSPPRKSKNDNAP